MLRGLIIKEPWIDLILNGDKTWEIRGTNTTIRGRIALIKSGTASIIGTVELIDTQQLSIQEFNDSEGFHCINTNNNTILPYPKTYTWKLTNPTLLSEPLPYRHPQGAVIWVKLYNLD